MASWVIGHLQRCDRLFPASFIARLRRQREAAAARGGTADGQTAWPWELNEAYLM